MNPTNSSRQAGRVPHPWVLAVGAGVLVTGQIIVGRLVIESATPMWVLVLLGLASVLPILAMQRWPWPVFVAASVAASAYGFVGARASLTWVGPIVGVYVISMAFGRRHGIASALVAAFALGLPGAMELTVVGSAINFGRMLLLSGAAAAFGEANRERRARMVEAELRAEQAELARATEAALIVDEERLRIARELHDVTAHSLSVIAVQSELARKTMQTRPETALQAVEAIGEVSRQSLGELRTMLGQLRGVAGEHSSTEVASLAAVGELIRALELAGCTVDSDVEPLRDLTPFVDATAFRIVQEATTNIIRHAPGSAVKLRVRVVSGDILLDITNTVASTPQNAAEGHGLPGMRERALALGGTLKAGIYAGVWTVSACLPLNGELGSVRS